jgi:hypothetical protein
MGDLDRLMLATITIPFLDAGFIIGRPIHFDGNAVGKITRLLPDSSFECEISDSEVAKLITGSETIAWAIEGLSQDALAIYKKYDEATV